mmetsp:Transcript_10231/g.24456  ORF Transcript_10231/g.24456 Transcript_10231/m.24456 type:complete len:97 (-) Transcript_10231:2725-3015(-)
MMPFGIGMLLQMVFPMDAQLTGLSLGSTSQHATGHSSIKWLQEVGIELGCDEGSDVGFADGIDDGCFDGTAEGADDGTGDGSGVGLQLILSSGSRH